MKEFVDKLISRLEEKVHSYYKQYMDDIIGYSTYNEHKREITGIIEIVNELAEEYKLLKNIEQLNNGWIPCSERLPEDNTNVIVCFRTGTVKVLRYEDTGIFRGINEYTTMVIIAWMPLPAPYKEGVTENE